MGHTELCYQRSTGRWAWIMVALALWTAATAGAQKIEDLSTTWIGELVAGETGRLAVSWSGTAEAELTVWVDFDGDGDFSEAELVVDRAVLGEGIEVFEVEVPEGSVVDERTRMRLRLLGDGERVGQEVARAVVGEKGDEGCEWASGFHIRGMSSTVRASVVFDDGSGPALYIGGEFTAADDVIVNRLAKWDGATWSSLGIGMDDDVRALTVYDDGSGPALYAGGEFELAGGVGASRIAKWDGEVWTPLGTGMNGMVYALTEYDDGNGPALFAGGLFTTAGGVSASKIAKWDGEAWSSLDTGMDGGVRVLTVYDDGSDASLYAGGSFTTAGGVSASRIAKWDGEEWAPLGAGMDDSVLALTVYDDGSEPALYAGGMFITAGGVSARYLARWDGAAWTPLGTGMNKTVLALTVYDDGSGPALYAGGLKWDGVTWTPLGTGMNSTVLALTVYDDGSGAALYAGGYFTTAGGVVANRIAKWDDATWTMPSSVVDGSGLDGRVLALTVHDDGGGAALYAGGYFTIAGGVNARNIAKWDGVAWTPLGTGIGSTVLALTVYDDGSGPALFAGGTFGTAGGVSASRIAKWDGEAWSPLGTGMNDIVYALTVYDDGSGPALHAAGLFSTAGGVSAERIAKWDGATWATLGTGVSSTVQALAVYDDGSGMALYAGGFFTTAGGVSASRIAKWDGEAWTPLGTGINSTVFALTVYDDGSGPALHAGGVFTSAGGVSAIRIAKWDGAVWTPLSIGLNLWVFALTVYDDGDGPSLYAGGEFTTAGGVSANFIATWDGVTWAPLGTGMDERVYALTASSDGNGSALFAGGWLAAAGGSVSTHIAKWSCPTIPDLSITKNNTTTEVIAGDTTTYTITTTNAGPDDAPSASLTDTFPPDLTCSWTSTADGGATGNTTGSGPTLEDTLSMPAGSSVTYTVTCDIDPGTTGQLTNIATVSAAGDPNLDNNVAIDTDTVIQESDLGVTLTNGTSEVIVGGTATYSLVVTNDGPSDDAPTNLSDTFPPELADCRWHSTADAGATGNTSGDGPTISDTLAMPAGSSARYVITCAVPAAASGTVAHTATVTSSTDPNPANDSATDSDPLVIIATVKTVILTHVQRLLTHTDPDTADLEALLTRLHDFAAHPNVQGLVIDAGHSADLAGHYALWDDDVAAGIGGATTDPDLANNVLFSTGGLHDLLRQQLTSHPEAEYLMLVGDDRILPMARIQDFTFYTTERDYTPLGNLTPGLTTTNTTVGQAAARNRYLSDDPLALRDPFDVTMLDEFLASVRPELAAGRLVETPAEIVYSLDVFLALEGLLDLTGLDPDHRVLVTGYDFLRDSASRIRRRWKNVFGEPEPHDPYDLIPVDGQLISRTWDLPDAGERADALFDHLSGRGLGHYGILSLNGHATHYLEGVPGAGGTDIQGLSTALIDTLDLTGSVVYAVGCHSGLPVAGAAATAADHPLDLPQTLLRSGVLAHVANSGFGWGLRHGVGYSERMALILTEELSRGGAVTFGDAVVTAKTRYYFEDMFVDPYDIKTSMQHTLFGFPMVSIHTGITTPAAPDDAGARKEGIVVDRRRVPSFGGEPPPDYLIPIGMPIDLTAGGLFKKYTTEGEIVPPGTNGCPPPPTGEDEGCYYTLNDLATAEGDLPIEPFLLELSILAGTSQHGILWLGGSYQEETAWVPLFAELASNGGTVPLPSSLPPRMEWVHPRDGLRGDRSANQDDCRATDTALNNVGVVTAELLFDDQLEPTIHRLHRQINLELFYYNNTDTGEGNCDRIGPEFGAGPYHTESDATVHWSVPATDDGGVWRVIAVYDDVANSNWVPVEMTYDAPSDRWQGDLVFPGGAADLVYFLQAVDNRGNVAWAEFLPEDASPSGIERRLAMPFEASTDDSDADGVPNDVDACPGFDDALDADDDGVPDGCDVCPGPLIVPAQDVLSTVVYESCDSITVEGGFHVLAPGDVTLRAPGPVGVGNDVSVQAGAGLRIEIVLAARVAVGHE